MKVTRLAQVGLVVAGVALGFVMRAESPTVGTTLGSARSGAPTGGSCDRAAGYSGAQALDGRPSRVRIGGAAGGAPLPRPVVVADELPREERPLETERVPAWAAPMEDAFRATALPRILRLFPAAEATVECFASSCRVAMMIEPGEVEKTMRYVSLAVPLGPAQEVAVEPADGRVRGVFTVDLRETSTVADWQAWQAQVHAMVEARIDEILAAEQRGESWEGPR